MQHNNGKAYTALCITSIIWGTTWVASKIGIHSMPALQMASVRQLIAGFCFVFFFMGLRKYPLPTRAQFKWIFIMAMLMFVMANGLSTWSLTYMPTGLSALIGALYPLSVVLIERIFFGSKKITPITMAGLLLGITGVGIVFSENVFTHTAASYGKGLTLAVIAMLSWSLGSVFISRNKSDLNPYYSTGWQMVISSVMLFIAAVATGQRIPLSSFTIEGWLVIAYLVLLGSVLSFIAFIYTLKKLPPALSSIYAYINPLVAMATAALVLGEKLTAYMAWGALVTMTGVYLVNYSVHREAKKSTPLPEQ
ncbi:MAG: EamA family transporter [Ferruginibacter sp.]